MFNEKFMNEHDLYKQNKWRDFENTAIGLQNIRKVSIKKFMSLFNNYAMSIIDLDDVNVAHNTLFEILITGTLR